MKQYRRILFFLSACIFIVLLTGSVCASDNMRIFADNREVPFTDAFPHIENNRTYVPIRAVAEAMGAEVSWEESVRRAVLTKKGIFTYENVEYPDAKAVCVFRPNQYYFRIKLFDKDGNEIFNVRKSSDVAVKSENGRLFLPVRFLGFGLGFSVQYDAPNVFLSFTGNQTLDFSIDTATKYPNSFPVGVYGNTFQNYYKGYGYVSVINADEGALEFSNYDMDGKPRYRYVGNFPRFGYGGHTYTFESDRTDIDLLEFDAEKNLSDFMTEYDYITQRKHKRVSHKIQNEYSIEYQMEYNTYDNIASVGYRKDCNTGKVSWTIHNDSPQWDVSVYRYLFNESWVNGSKHHDLYESAGDTVTLYLMHSFLGETGDRIMNMMYDFYNSTGYQAVKQDTAWYSDNYLQDRPVMQRNIPEYYGLTVNGWEENTVYGSGDFWIYCPEIGGDVRIHYGSYAAIGFHPTYTVYWETYEKPEISEK